MQSLGQVLCKHWLMPFNPHDDPWSRFYPHFTNDAQWGDKPCPRSHSWAAESCDPNPDLIHSKSHAINTHSILTPPYIFSEKNPEILLRTIGSKSLQTPTWNSSCVERCPSASPARGPKNQDSSDDTGWVPGSICCRPSEYLDQVPTPGLLTCYLSWPTLATCPVPWAGSASPDPLQLWPATQALVHTLTPARSPVLFLLPTSALSWQLALALIRSKSCFVLHPTLGLSCPILFLTLHLGPTTP